MRPSESRSLRDVPSSVVSCRRSQKVQGAAIRAAIASRSANAAPSLQNTEANTSVRNRGHDDPAIQPAYFERGPLHGRFVERRISGRSTGSVAGTAGRQMLRRLAAMTMTVHRRSGARSSAVRSYDDGNFGMRRNRSHYRDRFQTGRQISRVANFKSISRLPDPPFFLKGPDRISD